MEVLATHILTAPISPKEKEAFNQAIRDLEIEERKVRLLERRAKALSIIAQHEPDPEQKDAFTLFLSSYARRGDTSGAPTIAVSTFFSKFLQYTTQRRLVRDRTRRFAAVYAKAT